MINQTGQNRTNWFDPCPKESQQATRTTTTAAPATRRELKLALTIKHTVEFSRNGRSPRSGFSAFSVATSESYAHLAAAIKSAGFRSAGRDPRWIRPPARQSPGHTKCPSLCHERDALRWWTASPRSHEPLVRPSLPGGITSVAPPRGAPDHLRRPCARPPRAGMLSPGPAAAAALVRAGSTWGSGA